MLILGAGGMLGHAVFRVLSSDPTHQVIGSVRAPSAPDLGGNVSTQIITGVDAEQPDSLIGCFGSARPEVVVNCIGLVKQLAGADDPVRAMAINAQFPHRLAGLCKATGARLVHISTDCVFSGARGGYREQDTPDASDLYGRSKLLGEVVGENAVTLRTSIIGHELGARHHGLLGWFLSQPGAVSGYRRAIFSGLPTVELACAIRDRVLPRPDLHGLFHVASDPISKHDLLVLIADAYGRTNAIAAVDEPVVDRSLNGERFSAETGYRAPPWPELVRRMRDFG